MTHAKYVCLLFIALAPGLFAASAQQPPSASNSIALDVAVDSKSGQPGTGLGQSDFTVLDNKTPRPITSFKVMSGAQEPVRVIIFLDAANVPYHLLSYARQGVDSYLKSNQGKLAYPTEIAVLTDQGAEIDNGFSTNGAALSDSLEHHTIGLREIGSHAQRGWTDRLDISLKATSQLLAYTSTLPGRKIILWVSPGWPLPSGPRVMLTEQQENLVFNTAVSFSTQMTRNHVTLYNINPIGVGESLMAANYYKNFLNGLQKPGSAQLGNISVQVLAVHSGGLAIESNSDVAGNIKRCLADAQSWYQIGFDPIPADAPNEYHHIEVKVNRPDLTVRASDEYYANPKTAGTR
jgi:VWFA-related protein